MGCFLGLGDCGSTSSTTTNINNTNLVIDRKVFDTINSNTNSAISNSIVKSASSCDPNASSNQNVSIDLDAVEGTLNIKNINLKQRQKLTLSCVQADVVKSDVNNKMLSDMMNSLNTKTNQKVLSELSSASVAGASSGFGSTAASSASTNTNVTNNNTSISDVTTNLKNIINNSIENNFTSETIRSCSANLKSSQSFVLAAKKAVKGDVNIDGISLDQSSELISNCVQQQDIAAKVLTDVSTRAGVSIVAETTQESTTKIKTESEATSKSSGIFDGLASLFSGIFGGLLGAFAVPIILGIIGCVIGFIMYMWITSSGDKRISKGGGMNKHILENIHIGEFAQQTMDKMKKLK